MADLMMLDALENDTNETSILCEVENGRFWWVFLATIAVTYIVCLLLCSAIYAIYWLLIKRGKTPGDQKRSTNNCFGEKTFSGIMRQLKSGDTIPGKILITVTLICNVGYMALAVYRSLPPNQVEECIQLSNPKIIVELVLVCELLLFAFVRFFASKNIIFFWFDPYSMVDVCTLSHIFITIALGVDWVGLRFLRFAWLIQIVTVLQFTRLISSQNAIDLIQVLINFLVLWLASSGILFVIESGGDVWREVSNRSEHSILTYIYLTMVTMSTVGYGDVSPVTDLGKGFMIFFIIGGLAFFAAILPELVDVITRYYASSQYARFDTSRVPRHVIVCGHVTAVSAEDFLKDFLHPDRGDNRTHVLFLHPERPNHDLKVVLRKYYTRVQFLVGSVMKSHDLHKAKILNSSAIFILADKNAENPKDEDHANMLRVVSVKNTTGKIPVIIQVIHSFSKNKVVKLEGWSVKQDIAVSINELKLGVLGMSCLCPGLSTLIANFFYTIDVDKFAIAEAEHEAWKKEYADGMSNELYSVGFSETFDGATFHEAARICFNILNVILVAVDNVEGDVLKLYINPSPEHYPKLRIASKTMLGYFMAQDQKQVFDVSIYCNCCEDNKHIASMQAVRRFKRQLVLARRRTTAFNPKRGLTFANFKAKRNDNLDYIETAHNAAQSDSVDLAELVVEISGGEKKVPATNGVANGGGQSNFTSLGSFDDESDDEDEENEDEEDELTSVGKSRMHICDPVRMDDAILNLSVLRLAEESRAQNGSVTLPRPSRLRDHIVLCLFARAKSPLLGLYNFLKPLRSKHIPLEDIKPVVIVCDKDFVQKEWPNICRIPQVYLVVGSPLLWKNLKAANIMSCSVCVVLTGYHFHSSHEQAIDDKEAILCTLSIKKHLKKSKRRVTIITDLRQESNVQFLDFGDDDKPDERIFKSQPYACGEAFSVSMFDSVTSSAFHNPGTLSIVEDLINSSGEKDSQVVLVPLKYTNFIGRPYKEFYTAHLRRYNVCLGISRLLPESNGHSYYVASCPAKELILKETDIAFMLSTSNIYDPII